MRLLVRPPTVVVVQRPASDLKEGPMRPARPKRDRTRMRSLDPGARGKRHPIWRSSAAIIAVAAALSMGGGILPASGAGIDDGPFYLSLGDSLATGFQPGRGSTRHGYVEGLWRTVREHSPDLELKKLGCPGESSASMISGEDSLCDYAAGSQLDAAVKFLERHPGEVSFITIDVGANDVVDACLDFDSGLLHRACVIALLPRLTTRITESLAALGAAAGPDVPILGMNYHVPFLGLWGLVPRGRHLARVDARAFEALNDGLESTYGDAGVTVADVARTYQTDNFTDTVVIRDRGRLPVNVALACRWTWFCSDRYFGDPHPNRTGYARVARTFYRELRSLLP